MVKIASTPTDLQISRKKTEGPLDMLQQLGHTAPVAALVASTVDLVLFGWTDNIKTLKSVLPA